MNQIEKCIHRFSNGKSALVEIGEGKCRCELCNLDLFKEIVDDSYTIETQDETLKKITELDLEKLFDEEENL